VPPPYELVHADRSKRARGEPVATLYERGRVHHIGRHPELEEEMTSFTGEPGERSPDRLDALVHALTALMGYGISGEASSTGVVLPWSEEVPPSGTVVRYEDAPGEPGLGGAPPSVPSGRDLGWLT